MNGTTTKSKHEDRRRRKRIDGQVHTVYWGKLPKESTINPSNTARCFDSGVYKSLQK